MLLKLMVCRPPQQPRRAPGVGGDHQPCGRLPVCPAPPRGRGLTLQVPAPLAALHLHQAQSGLCCFGLAGFLDINTINFTFGPRPFIHF